jgi:hypothetical protein
MGRKITDPKLRMFMEFFESQGVKFVDVDTGEILTTEGEGDEDNL